VDCWEPRAEQIRHIKDRLVVPRASFWLEPERGAVFATWRSLALLHQARIFIIEINT